jgi:hypothetical protein
MEKAARVIAETAGNLAKKRIGALIVIAGSDPLGRHLTGGVALDGRLSEPLLASIFDPHSMGHDGAVVIKNGRVALFGCHLPLSVNIAQHGNIGLRHTAALGLTERSDALCIVVSEERGTISVADRETLTVVPGASTLNEILERYYIRYRPAPRKRPLWGWLRENTKEKVIALVLACMLWVAFGYQRDIVRAIYGSIDTRTRRRPGGSTNRCSRKPRWFGRVPTGLPPVMNGRSAFASICGGRRKERNRC